MFESARGKIDRAREHFDFLKADFARFIRGKPYTIRKEPDPDSDSTLLVYYPDPIPPGWSLVLGELLYDLRSDLDHAVYDIGGGKSGSEFPICDHIGRFFETKGNLRTFTGRSGVHKIRGVANNRAWSYIEAMQPYAAENPEQHPLSGLQELNNIDKHRTLHLCRRSNLWSRWETDRPFTFSESWVFMPKSLEQRAIVGRLRGVDSEVNVDHDFASVITFDEGEVPEVVGYPVEPICIVLIKQVAMVVDRIESIVVG